MSTQFGRKFVTLNVHLRLQHVCRDAAYHAGSSATADTCFYVPDLICHPTTSIKALKEAQSTDPIHEKSPIGLIFSHTRLLEKLVLKKWVLHLLSQHSDANTQGSSVAPFIFFPSKCSKREPHGYNWDRFFTGRMFFISSNKQHQNTKGNQS